MIMICLENQVSFAIKYDILFILSRHLILAVIVLGYGIFRVIQIKKTGMASMHMWSIDVLTVTLMCIALMPAVFKIFAVERLSYKMKR